MSDLIQGRESWHDYNIMMIGREVVDFNNPDFCKKCGRRNGDHLTDYARSKNPRACKFKSHNGWELEKHDAK